MTGFEVGALAALITAVAGAFAVFYKVRPESDSLVITQAQGAATILNDLVDTLRAEVQRERELRRQGHERLNELLVENAKLKLELDGLRARFGTRASDPDGESAQ